MVHSETRKKWIKELNVSHISDKMVWVSDNNRINNLDHKHVLPQPEDDYLKRLSE